MKFAFNLIIGATLVCFATTTTGNAGLAFEPAVSQDKTNSALASEDSASSQSNVLNLKTALPRGKDALSSVTAAVVERARALASEDNAGECQTAVSLPYCV